MLCKKEKQKKKNKKMMKTKKNNGIRRKRNISASQQYFLPSIFPSIINEEWSCERGAAWQAAIGEHFESLT